MNVSSTPPIPLPLVTQTGRGPVQPARANDPARDATSEDERKPPAVRIPSELSEEDRRRAAQFAAVDRHPGEGARQKRAMAAYAGVAQDDERRHWQSLLGLDTYA